MQEARGSATSGGRSPAARGLQEVGKHHGGIHPKATNPEHMSRGRTLSAGWLLCDRGPFVLTEERISNLQLLQVKSAGLSALSLGRGSSGSGGAWDNRYFSCTSADNIYDL